MEITTAQYSVVRIFNRYNNSKLAKPQMARNNKKIRLLFLIYQDTRLQNYEQMCVTMSTQADSCG